MTSNSADEWRRTTLERARKRGLLRDDVVFETTSHIDEQVPYTGEDLAARGWDERERLGFPGEFPFTRGVQASMYRGRLWTMRQYAGYASAADTNRRFKFLLEQGQTGLSVAFDLPTQMGYDADATAALGEVGRVGVPIG